MGANNQLKSMCLLSDTIQVTRGCLNIPQLPAALIEWAQRVLKFMSQELHGWR